MPREDELYRLAWHYLKGAALYTDGLQELLDKAMVCAKEVAKGDK